MPVVWAATWFHVGVQGWPCQCEWPLLPPRVVMTSEPMVLPVTISGFMVLPYLRLVLMSMSQGNTEGHMDSGGQGHNLWPYWCLRNKPQLKSFWSVWSVLPYRTMVLSGPRLLHRVMSMPCQGLWPFSYQCWCLWLLLAPKAVRIPGVCIATWDHISVLRPCCSQGHTDLGGRYFDWCHDDIQEQVAARSHVHAHGSSASGFCVDAHGLHCHRGS